MTEEVARYSYRYRLKLHLFNEGKNLTYCIPLEFVNTFALKATQLNVGTLPANDWKNVKWIKNK